MGQALVDLPDPLNPPPDTAASTDDLLAQMAGEEIDRMLAEADAEGGPSAIGPAQAATAQPPALLPVAAPPSPEPTPAAQLGDFLGQIAAEAGPEPAVQAIPQGPARTQSMPSGAATEADDETDEDELLAAERGALSNMGGGRSISASALDDFEDLSRPPLYLRLLEWLNAPLDACSEDARELIGKVAIVTAVNAISVLAYVLFFRRHG